MLTPSFSMYGVPPFFRRLARCTPQPPEGGTPNDCQTYRVTANEFSFGLHHAAATCFLCAVLKLRLFIKYWLPVVVWFCLIFGASADRGSVQHSSRLIGPLVRWLFPHLPPETVNSVVYLVRKCAHVCEYAVLAWLFWRAFRRPQKI